MKTSITKNGFSGKVIIIGGGIAGNALALFLHKAGIRAEVYEARTEDQAGLGGGFGIAPNGMAVLDALGLAEKTAARGSVIHENCFSNAAGKVLAKFKNGSSDHKYPAVSMLRSALQQILAEAVQEQGIPLHFSKRLVSLSDERDQVVACFEDGTQAVGDLLIGTDGIYSQTRRLVFPDTPSPQFVGIVGVGGVVSAASVPQITQTEKQRFNFIYGRRGFFGYAGVENGDVMWWSNLPAKQEAPREALMNISLEGIKKDMLAVYGDYQEPIPTLIRNTHSPVKHNISDIQSLPAWHKGRVLLIGDAAHAVSPNSGQGGSMALEDAMLLAKLLRDGGDHEQVFATFEEDRRPRVEKVVAEGRRRGNDKKIVSPFQQKIREFMMRIFLNLFGLKGYDWVYNYRIAWD